MPRIALLNLPSGRYELEREPDSDTLTLWHTADPDHPTPARGIPMPLVALVSLYSQALAFTGVESIRDAAVYDQALRTRAAAPVDNVVRLPVRGAVR